MVFSDTTNKNGIIQRCEKWTNLGDGTISGDPTLIKVFTADINDAFDEIMPFLLSFTDKGRFDDLNNSDYPIAQFNLVSGQNDYSVKVDGSSLDILRILDVQVLQSASSTLYQTISKLTLHDPRALSVMSPNSTDIGIPDSWLERDNTIFLGPNPNYSAINGVKAFFERVQSYFLYTDTTKAPGIPRIFHPLLHMIASRDWLSVNKANNTVTLATLNQKIADMKQSISDYMSMRNPTQARMGVATNPATDNRRWADSNQ